MGKGIDLAAITNPEVARAVEDMRDQLVIVLLKRLGGSIEVPVAELDDTDRDNLGMFFDQGRKVFTFEIIRNPVG